jgi:cell division transport system ATP-binding protein
MIFFDSVSKIYPSDFFALKDINLNIESGEFVSIVGQSGAGKTTVLKLLTAEETPTKGKVVLDNYDINFIKPSYLPKLRQKIGVIFQDFKLLDKRTVFENVSFALEMAGKTNEEIQNLIPQLLEIVGLSEKINNYPNELSGGERQRVSIARALVHKPKILLADEPTGNLDMINSWDIIQLLLKINQYGTTVVLATHNREVINSLNKRVITLDRGRVIKDQEKGRYII